MRPRAFVIAVIASAGCKTDANQSPPAPRPSAPAPVKQAPPAPRPPTAAAGRELIDTLLLSEPSFTGATPLAPLKMIEEREQARQSWCMAGSDAMAIAGAMTGALRTAGWREITSRGTAERAVIGGTIDNVSVAITVGGTDASCTGLVATAHYTTSTVLIPPIDDGERVR